MGYYVDMKLTSYLKQSKISDTKFATKVGMTIYAVRKWKSGQRYPRYETMRMIHRVTKGKVSLKDWKRDWRGIPTTSNKVAALPKESPYF